MTKEEFFERIIDFYQESRKVSVEASNIHRGRSASISSKLEDLTAAFINEAIPRNCVFYTDQPITLNGTTRYPDILIQESDGTLSHLVDVKTDLGWKRNKMFEYSEKWDKIIENSKGQHVNFKSGIDKKNLTGRISEKLKLHVVIASLKNSGSQLKSDYENIKASYSNIEIYILSQGIHPNDYNHSKNELLQKIEIRDSDFSALIRNLQ